MINWFKSLNSKNKALVIILGLILLLYLYKKYYWKVRLFFTQKVNFETIDYSTLTDTKKESIKRLAEKWKEEASGWWYSFLPYSIDMTILESMGQLNDVELKYLADYYNNSLGGDIVSSIDDISAGTYEVDDVLIMRLNSIGYA